jgi:hypothetical protein
MPEEPKPEAGKPNNEPAPGAGDGGAPKPADGGTPPAEGTPKPPEGGEPKPEGEGKPEGGAPEKYEDFKVPENVELDADDLAVFSEAAKGMGLSQENAQKLVDFGVKIIQGAEELQNENRNSTLDTWEKEIKADEEYGGDKLGETLDRGRRVVREHGTPELHTLIEASGLGSNPHLLRFLAKIDKALGEDRAVDGKPAPEKRDAAAALYDGK